MTYSIDEIKALRAGITLRSSPDPLDWIKQELDFMRASPAIVDQLVEELRESEKRVAGLMSGMNLNLHKKAFRKLLEENERLKAEIGEKDRDETEREILKVSRENTERYKMPYIKQEDRPELDQEIQALADKIKKVHNKYGYDGAFAGLLNYSVTTLCLKLLPARRYWVIALVTGVLKNIADEFYRKYGVPYEDEQIKANGDVYK